MATIFHYDSIEKFFLGSEEIGERPADVGLPAFSTNIPPPEFTQGQIPVFEGTAWIVVEDRFFHPRYIEVNYDAGRLMSTYRPMTLSYIEDFPIYPSIAQINSSALTVIGICDRYKLIHKKLHQIIELHSQFMCSAHLEPTYIANKKSEIVSLDPLGEYKLECETMVFLMRRVIDLLIQLTYLLTNKAEFKETLKVNTSELGKVLSQPETPLAQVILGGGQYEADNTEFLPIINALFNSFKHCLMHEDSRTLIGIDFPTVISYFAKHNDHKTIIEYHNHNIYHLVMGFQDTVARILRNQKASLSLMK